MTRGREARVAHSDPAPSHEMSPIGGHVDKVVDNFVDEPLARHGKADVSSAPAARRGLRGGARRGKAQGSADIPTG